MPRRREPPRLWLRPADRNRPPTWIILDGTKHIRTGCGERDIEQAQRQLADYIKAKFEPPTGLGSQLLISEVLAGYLQQHAVHASSLKTREFLRATCKPLLERRAGKTIADVKGINRRAYTHWRTAQARHPNRKTDKDLGQVSEQTRAP